MGIGPGQAARADGEPSGVERGPRRIRGGEGPGDKRACAGGRRHGSGDGSERMGEEPVFNIEVDGDHCYRVGERGVLVHNAYDLLATAISPNWSVRRASLFGAKRPAFENCRGIVNAPITRRGPLTRYGPVRRRGSRRPKIRRQSCRTFPAQRSAATTCRFVASSPGYRVPTANRVKYLVRGSTNGRSGVEAKFVPRSRQNVNAWNRLPEFFQQSFQILLGRLLAAETALVMEPFTGEQLSRGELVVGFCLSHPFCRCLFHAGSSPWPRFPARMHLPSPDVVPVFVAFGRSDRVGTAGQWHHQSGRPGRSGCAGMTTRMSTSLSSFGVP